MTHKPHHSHSSLRDVLRPLVAHLFAVLAVSMIAVALGLMGAREKMKVSVIEHEQLASPTASGSTPNSVQFSVVVTDDVSCQNNVPLTTIGFLSLPPDGGMFHLVSSNSLDVPFISGSYPLANGVYSWYAIPKEGLSVAGPTTGVITLQGDCRKRTNSTVVSDAPPPSVGGSSVSNVTPTTIGAATMTPILPATSSPPIVVDAIPLPRPILKLFKDNIPLGETGDAEGVVELRVSDSDVKSVEFILLQKEGEQVPLGKGVFDKFLSDQDYTTWEYFWNTASTSGIYKVYAVVTHGSGAVDQTLPVSLSLIPPRVLTAKNMLPVALSSTDTLPILSSLTPETCTTEAECQRFCRSTQAHKDACIRFVRTRLGSTTESGEFFAERVGARLFIDSDGDGIRDYDEVNLYATDPERRDTDKDGFSDGQELLGATNPRGGTSTSEALANLNAEIAASPELLESIVPLVSSLSILHVGVLKSDTVSSSSPVEIVASGKALPNSYVTLFIFSRPVAVVVATDREGNFTYTLPHELADGTHRIYATISAMNGTPLLRSEGYVFVKRGNHVGHTHALPLLVRPDVDMQSTLFDSSLVASLFLFGGLIFFVCAFWWHKRNPQSALVNPHRHQKPFGHVVYLK